MSDHPFQSLTPEFIMDAVESLGFYCDGRLLALNSYENRVYQVGIEDGQPLIAKFYRPHRWSDEQILEEHQFSLELAEQELPVVPPMTNAQNTSLHHFQGFRVALFERKGGRAPELDYQDNLTITGRLLARMHNCGARQRFAKRPAIDIQSYGIDSRNSILEHAIPKELRPAYDSLSRDLIATMQQITQQVGPLQSLRVHGDCHVGNMLWRDEQPQFVDFDDARMAPAVQDIWMLLSGEREAQARQLDLILQGYLDFRDFDYTELQLIEVLRTLRIMHYSAWLAQRWSDPAFPLAFPWFGNTRYWEEHILELREQLYALQQGPVYPERG